MMETKTRKKFLVILLTFMLVVMYGALPQPNTAQAVDSLTDAKDTLSDSDISASSVTHTIQFTTGTTTPTGGFFSVHFPSEFSLTGASVTCPTNTTASTSGQLVDCVASADLSPAAYTITVSGTTNPGTAGSYTINVYNYYDASTLKERVQLPVYIIEDVLMTASVNASLTFNIYGVNSGVSVNGIECSNTSTATSTPFGTLTVNATSTVCQRLTVATNADDGYIVTVEQDQELTSDSGSNINSFNNSPDGTGSTTAQAWESPRNELDNYYTYGHMGLTSNDADLDTYGYNDFDNGGSGAYFAGLNGTDPMVIMHHNGPADGSTQNKGLAYVLYQVEIGSLQEAGDYENKLTYIVTATY
jgi:hypothetical protein